MVSDICHFHPYSSIFMMPIFSLTFLSTNFLSPPLTSKWWMSNWPKLRGLAGYQLLPADLERASCVTFLRSGMVPRVHRREMPRCPSDSVSMVYLSLSLSLHIYIYRYRYMCLYLIIIYIYTYTIIIYIY